MASPPSVTIAHLSDTHFGGRPSAAGRTRRVLDHVAAMDPPVDVVLVTGDIADHGLTEEYALAGQVLGEWPGPAPMLTLPGNHDVRAAYAAWQGLPADGPLHTAQRVAGALFVLLDSMVPAPPGERNDHGELDEDSLRWLDAQLAARARGEPAYVCLHHPPVDIHSNAMDPIRLRNPERLAEVLIRHEDIGAVLCGHVHSMLATTFAGVPMLAGGGIATTVTLDAEALPFLTETLPPSFALHLVGDDGRVVTHWRTV